MIRAKHPYTQKTLILEYSSIKEAQRRNPVLVDWEYIL